MKHKDKNETQVFETPISLISYVLIYHDNWQNRRTAYGRRDLNSCRGEDPHLASINENALTAITLQLTAVIYFSIQLNCLDF